MDVTGGGRPSSPSGDLQLSRERSNSDPGFSDSKIVMNGGNTVPTRRAPAFLTTAEIASPTRTYSGASSASTPPPFRRNKLAASIGRLFRPWKWRKRKKSQKFITASESLERQLSVRSKRDELIKKGILPVNKEETLTDSDSDSPEKECNGLSNEDSAINDKDARPVPPVNHPPKQQARPMPPPARSILPTENEVKKDIQVQEVDRISMMTQLAQEFGIYVVVQSVGSGYEHREESDSDEENTHYRRQDDSYSDSEEEEETKGVITGLASKLKRKDSLALKLRARPSQRELEARNILPTKTEEEKQERKNEVGTKLIRRLSTRPTAQELIERNILKSSSEEEEKEEKEEKKRVLTRKLSKRPTVQELRAKKILKFNDYVEVCDVHDYDRRADKPWTRLTPEDKAAIRKELNEYKSTEMEVHEESKQFTRFHRP